MIWRQCVVCARSEDGGAYHQKVIGNIGLTGETHCSDAISAGMDGHELEIILRCTLIRYIM